MTTPAHDQTVITAARRDASWHDSPGEAWKYHIVVDQHAACSPPQVGRRARMVLAEFTERFAIDVAAGMRCRRPGCRQRWPEEKPS